MKAGDGLESWQRGSIRSVGTETMSLTAAQLESLDTNGFLSFESPVSTRSIVELRSVYGFSRTTSRRKAIVGWAA